MATASRKGSLVALDRFRFDFSHMKAVTPREIGDIETRKRRHPSSNDEVATRVMPYDAIASGRDCAFRREI
ncbi:MAG: hypothetical protein R3C60_02120 [Parvularculaceae bacterium]